MRVGRAATASALALGLVALGCQGYYRLPRTPSAEGSFTNEIAYAYFTMVQRPAWALPYGYTEFDPATDESVTFILHVSRGEAPFTIHGTVYRPDGSVHGEFQRNVPARVVGMGWAFTTSEALPMSALRAWQGWWRVELSREGVPLGRYRFLVADSTTIERFRTAR